MPVLLDVLVVLLAAAVVTLVAVLPLPAIDQAVVGAYTVLAALVFSAIPGRWASLCLVALSLATSLRYLFWRLTETVPQTTAWQTALAIGLVAAELYAVVSLVLGYIQTALPRGRQPTQMPDDATAWPAVDVLIPVVDEPEEVVRTTLLAATGMDWPPDRLHVWLLDDAGRPELRALATAAGAEYLHRAERTDAKAGNLAHGLAAGTAPLVLVLDSDQVATRALLQLTAGTLLAELQLGFVQLPHLQSAPDVFQRLPAAHREAAEQDLFHHAIQDGNDALGAALCTGSGTLFRRAALEAVGGFARGTLVEDVATGLALHRAGWGSAFLDLPLAAGLPPQRLLDHARQRARWLRGMVRLARNTMPALRGGLRAGQRVAYAQGGLHFLFPLPRLVFLTAPLLPLLADVGLIAAPPALLAAYAIPHLAHFVLARARLARFWRGTFWGTVQETAVALRLLPTLLAALFGVGPGRFTVTPKTDAPPPRFDLAAAWPNLLLAALLTAGIARGIGLLRPDGPVNDAGWMVLLATLWAALMLVAVLAGVAAARVRGAVGPGATAVDVEVRTQDGTVSAGRLRLRSVERGWLELGGTHPAGTALTVLLDADGTGLAIPSTIQAWRRGVADIVLTPGDTADAAALVRATLGRADAWLDQAAPPGGWAIPRAARVLAAITGLIRPASLFCLLILPATTLAATKEKPRSTTPAASKGMTVRPVPQPLPSFTPAAPPPPILAAPPPPLPPPNPASRELVLNLRSLGADGPVTLTGAQPARTLILGVRADEAVTAATLHVTGQASPALLAGQSALTVTVNDQPAGTLPLPGASGAFAQDIALPATLFRDETRIGFGFTGRVMRDCDDPLSPLVTATVAEGSTLSLTLQRLPAVRDLARLPRPFLDPVERLPATLPVVMPAEPTDPEARAAGMVAGWFGTQAGDRPISFPVLGDPPAQGDGVVIISGEAAGGAKLPGVDGPTLAVIPNPRDPQGSLLIVAGRTADELVTAATALAAGGRALTGDAASVIAPALTLRTPYDAPRWLAEGKRRLGDLVDPTALQVAGYAGLVRIPFRLAPDLATSGNVPLKLDLRWQAPPAGVAEGARLDAGVNGRYLATETISGPGAVTLAVPLDALTARNELAVFFDARPARRAACGGIPADFRFSLDPASTIDLTGAQRFARLPDLKLFASAGLPFTRLADLSGTAIILPERPDRAELALFLGTMARLGAITGVPGVKVAVARPATAAAVADRDLLLIGQLHHLGAAASLLSGTPVTLDGARLVLRVGATADPARPEAALPDAGAETRVEADLTSGFATLAAGRSPLAPPPAAPRSLVALLAGSPSALDALDAALTDPAQAALVQGDLAVVAGGKITASRAGETWEVGTRPPPASAWTGLEGSHARPFGLAALMVGGCALASAGVRGLAGRAGARRGRAGDA